jgi:hypothetical protein
MQIRRGFRPQMETGKRPRQVLDATSQPQRLTQQTIRRVAERVGRGTPGAGRSAALPVQR